jgi:phosphoribosyl 1,2-cyclic phosphodiesterase
MKTKVQEFSVRFWGVRGSIACPDAASLGYGGNTSCLEVRCAGKLFIFDGGTGLRYLGRALGDANLDCDLFLTHTHFDHVCGLPFFAPFFRATNRFRLWSGHLGARMGTREAITQLMAPPYHPVPPEIFRAQMDYRDFAPGDELAPAQGVRLSTAPLNHPDGAVGYRIEFGGRSIAYVTDTEHHPGRPDEKILKLIRGADIFIYDATYTDEEFATEQGKGHSTWQEGARLADAAGVSLYVPFHHEPGHNDAFLDRVAAALRARRPNSLLAREGLVLRPADDRKSQLAAVTPITGP